MCIRDRPPLVQPVPGRVQRKQRPVLANGYLNAVVGPRLRQNRDTVGRRESLRYRLLHNRLATALTLQRRMDLSLIHI